MTADPGRKTQGGMKPAMRPSTKSTPVSRAKDPGKKSGGKNPVAKAQSPKDRPSKLSPMGAAKKRVR